MNNFLKQLWQDEAGFIVSSELVLVATMLVIGMIVGLETIRSAMIQELGDVGQALGSLNQSYVYAAVTGHMSATAGGDYLDELDICDTTDDTTLLPPGCIKFIVGFEDEGDIVASDNTVGGGTVPSVVADAL